MAMERGRGMSRTDRPRPQHASTHGPSGTLHVTTLASPAPLVLSSRILPQIKPISGRKHAELNRQIRGVEHLVTYRKQTATTCSNRQKIQKWTSTFLPEMDRARTPLLQHSSLQTTVLEEPTL